MEKKYEQLLSKLERELENFVELPPLERMRGELDVVRTGLNKLYTVVEESDYGAQADVIEFLSTSSPGSIH